MNGSRSKRAAALFLAALAAGALWAAPAREISTPFANVPLPEGINPGSAVLEVSGRIGRAQPVYFDLASLKAFPVSTFEDSDPWDNQRHNWEGVALYPFLRRLGMDESAQSIEITAENNYKAAIRTIDLRRGAYLLAWRMDGELLGERTARPRRGVLQIAVNFAANPQLAVDVFKHQIVWQTRRIVVQ